MASYKLVDVDKLNAALTATANAIRAKLDVEGVEIHFDMQDQTGFSDAIELIQTEMEWEPITPAALRARLAGKKEE